jgi:cytoskeletal protein CcmA (bactofilin family)
MTAQETNLFNAFETTLTATMGSSDTTFSVNAVADSYPTTLSAPFYIVINPDSATNREVILVTAVDTGTKQLTTSVPNRYLPGSAASSGLSHSSGQTVRMAPLQQHIEDINDRVDTIINEAGTAVNTSLFLDEDDMASDSATKGVTQQSVKAYVDNNVTAQDLDITDGSTTSSVDLDSQTMTIQGTANEATVSLTGQTFTVGLPTSITVDVTGNLTGDVTGDVTGDLTGNVTATSVLADGVTATTQTTGDNSTKVATTAYVDANVTAQDLDLADGDGNTGAVDLDSQSLTLQGTADEVDVALSSQTYTIGLPATINANTTGSAATLTTARNFSLTGDVAASAVSFDGSGNVELTTTIQANSVALGADTTGDYVATLVGGYGIDSTGGASGEGTAHTLSLDVSELTEVTAVSTDYVVIEDATDNTTKKAPISDIIAAGDITAIVTDTNSGLAGGVTSGAADLTLDANNLASTTAVSSDYLVIQDVTDNSTKKALISDIVDLGDITNVIAGTNLNGGGDTGEVTLNLDTTITGLTSVTSTDFVGDLTGNADTATTLATSRNIAGQAFNGSADVTIEAGNLTDVSTSGVSDGQVLVYNNAASQFEPGSVGSATALIDGDSDFTLTDGIANGIHYELDNTDMADWNQAGIALTTAGGIFTHHQTQAATYTVAADTGSVMAGPITITGTVTNNGTLVVI